MVRVLCAEPYWTEPALDFILRLRRRLGAGRESRNNSRFNRLKSRRRSSSREASVRCSPGGESIREVFLEFANDRTARVSEIERPLRCRYRKLERKAPHEIAFRAGRAEVRSRSVGPTARENGLTSQDRLGSVHGVNRMDSCSRPVGEGMGIPVPGARLGFRTAAVL